MDGKVDGVTSLADYLKTLVHFTLECDSDCTCKPPPQAKVPWQPAVDYLLYDDKKEWEVYVTGINVKISVAPCFPKPTAGGGKKLEVVKKAPGTKKKK
jgi:hypothetical protein